MIYVILFLCFLILTVNSFIFTPKIVIKNRIQCNNVDKIIDINEHANTQNAEEVQAQLQAKIDAAEAAGENDFVNFLNVQFENLCKDNGNIDTISFEVFVTWKKKFGLYLEEEELIRIWEHVMTDITNGCDFVAFKEVNRLIDEAF